MNKLAVSLLAVAAASASCAGPGAASDLDSADNFADSLNIVFADFLGRSASYEIATVPDFEIDKKEMMRGLRTVLGTDTGNISYLTGLRAGLNVMDFYRDVAMTESIDRDVFINSFEAAFLSDTISLEELEALKLKVDSLMEIKERHVIEREEAEVFNTDAARLNRELGEAVADKLMSNPDFTSVGADGLMKRVITPGDGNVFAPDDVLTLDYTLRRADSRIEIASRKDVHTLFGRIYVPFLEATLPFMSAGEAAEFFVPYQLACGVMGNESWTIGPCESVMVEITMK